MTPIEFIIFPYSEHWFEDTPIELIYQCLIKQQIGLFQFSDIPTMIQMYPITNLQVYLQANLADTELYATPSGTSNTQPHKWSLNY